MSTGQSRGWSPRSRGHATYDVLLSQSHRFETMLHIPRSSRTRVVDCTGLVLEGARDASASPPQLSAARTRGGEDGRSACIRRRILYQRKTRSRMQSGRVNAAPGQSARSPLTRARAGVCLRSVQILQMRASGLRKQCFGPKHKLGVPFQFPAPADDHLEGRAGGAGHEVGRRQTVTAAALPKSASCLHCHSRPSTSH